MMPAASVIVNLWGPIAYLASLVLVATPFILYYTQTSIMYTITPDGCNSEIFANQSSWYTGPWVIIPAYGVCPEKTYSYTAMYGYGYQYCIDFSDESKWSDMDALNTAEGYRTYLSEGAKVWTKSEEFLIVGTVFLFLIPFGIIGLTSGENEEQVLMILTLLLAVPVALYLIVDMFFSVQGTDQIEPEAWALVMFQSCNITVTTQYGLYLVMYVIAVCGVLMVMSYGLVVYYGFKHYRKSQLERQAAAETAMLSVDNSSSMISDTGMLVSRSWMYGRTQTGAASNSNNGYGDRDESTFLLEDERAGGRVRMKDDARIYQVAVEYRSDINEYYPLPCAPASSTSSG